jgi:hypothetical protein
MLWVLRRSMCRLCVGWGRENSGPADCLSSLSLPLPCLRFLLTLISLHRQSQRSPDSRTRTPSRCYRWIGYGSRIPLLYPRKGHSGPFSRTSLIPHSNSYHRVCRHIFPYRPTFEGLPSSLKLVLMVPRVPGQTSE